MCSQTCGAGEQEVTRSIKVDRNEYGQECDVNRTITRKCNTKVCPGITTDKSV